MRGRTMQCQHGAIRVAVAVLALVRPFAPHGGLVAERAAPRLWALASTAPPSSKARRARSSPLLRTVPVRGATALAVDEDTRRVFVTCEFCYRAAGSVTMLDARTGSILRTVRVGMSPLAVAVDTTTRRVFVANQEANSVSVLDAQSGRLLQTVPLAGDPVALGVAERGGRVFVTDANDNTVSLLDARTGALRSTLTLHGGPFFRFAVAERAERVFVGASRDNTMSVLDARSGVVLYTRRLGTLGTGALPQVAAVDEHAGHVFSDQGDILDAHTGKVLRTGQLPGALAMTLNERTQQVFATSGDTLTVLDARTGTVLHKSPLDAPVVSGPAVIPQAGRVAVLLAAPTSGSGEDIVGPSALLVLDGSTGTVQRRWAMGALRYGDLSNYNLIAVDTQTKRVFVLDGSGVAVLDADRV